MVIQVEDLRLAYMAVPKAACSSVKRAIAEIDPSVDVDTLVAPNSEENSMWHGLYPTQRFRPHRWEKVPEDWFRFTVVRDPLKRLLSCYTDRVVKRRELHNSPRLRRGEANLPKDPDVNFFLQNLQAYKDVSSVVKHHALHIWLFTGPSLNRFTDVYCVSDMARLKDDLSDWTGRQVDFKRENKSKMNLSADDLTDATRAALRPWLREEYEFLSKFYPDPPFDLT